MTAQASLLVAAVGLRTALAVGVPPRFRDDNTEGYGPDDLAELNHRFDVWAEYETGPLDPSDPAFEELLDYVAERVRAEYDEELARRVA